MRVVSLVSVVFVAAIPGTLVAQGRGLVLDASIGGAGDAGRAAISLWRPVLRAPLNIRISVGLRASGYVAMSSPYRNRETVQGGLAPELSIDPGVLGANVAVSGELPVGPVSLGANLDLVGLATGAHWRQGSLEGEPETASVFQYGSADRGALNSEFYLAISVSDRMAIRAGASHYVTNYAVTDTAATGGPSARYQRFETVPFAALSVRF